MDSMGLSMSVGRELFLQIASVYKCDGEILTIRKLGVQQQVGKFDCGLFAVAHAVEACKGNDPEEACFDLKNMRKHLYNCLNQRVMKPFPQVRSQSLRKLVLRASSQLLWYELFCFCKMPDTYDDMMQCDQCSQWIHCSCAGLKNVKEVVGIVWKCSQCQGNGKRIKNKPKQFSSNHGMKKGQC